MAKARPGSFRVLVADDNESNRILCREMLTWLGVDAVTVNNGLQVLEAVASSHFDLILMDCRMPEMDGYAASREIRSREQEQGLERIPIIALTAHALRGDREASLAAGMDEHLSKPFRLQQLQSLLAIYLKPATDNSDDTTKVLPQSTHPPFDG